MSILTTVGRWLISVDNKPEPINEITIQQQKPLTKYDRLEIDKKVLEHMDKHQRDMILESRIQKIIDDTKHKKRSGKHTKFEELRYLFGNADFRRMTLRLYKRNYRVKKKRHDINDFFRILSNQK